MAGAGSRLPVQLVVLCALISGIHGQGCPTPTAEQLNGTGGLLSTAWSKSRAGEELGAPPDVQLFDFNIVCLATTECSGRYRRISLIANHTCQSDSLTFLCEDGPTVAQFTFTCNPDTETWDPISSGTARFSVRTNPVATLDTPLRTDCFSCVHPNQTSRTDRDQITHCLPCAVECRSSGSGQCVSFSGCCPFFRSGGKGCVDQCETKQRPDQNFICQDLEPVTIGFELSNLTFFESAGIATVTVSALASINFNFSIRVSGGPGDQPEDVVVSGINVSETIEQLPATVSFMITNDDIALEGDEIYSLSLSVIQCDGPLMVGGANLYNSTQITIVDDDDVIIGIVPPLLSSSYVFSEGDSDASITVGISNSIATSLNFTILAMRADGSQFISSSLQFPEDPYTIDVQFAPREPRLITIPLTLTDDDIALEDNEVVSFSVVPPGVPNVVIGGIVRTPEGAIMGVFQDSINVTVTDDDAVLVGFQQQLYVFDEGGIQTNVSVGRTPTVARFFTVRISGGPSPQEGLVVSGISIADVIMFNSGTVSPFVDVPILIRDDSVPNEPLEAFNLTLSDPSDSRIMIGGSIGPITLFAQTEINIVDDDIATTTEATTTIEPTTEATTTIEQTTEATTTIEQTTEAPTVPTTEPTTIPPTQPTTPATTQPPPTTAGPDPVTSPPPLLRNHTVIGDPLFTVPILISGNPDTLCYEIHGRASQYFNLISDACVSVAAAYVEVRANSTNDLLNVIGEVGVLAVNSEGECVRISIEAESCRAAVNSVPVDVMYASGGIRVRRGRNYVRVSVPNCADSALTMWTLCRSLEGNAMIKFVVTRGINLRESSHGLIGQFWNVPYSLSDFVGRLRDSQDSSDRIVMVTVTNPSGDKTRTFPAWREDLTWEGLNEPCLYAGNRQGGEVYEVLGQQDSVIEGNYAEYRVQGVYGTRFKYSHFNNTLCT